MRNRKRNESLCKYKYNKIEKKIYTIYYNFFILKTHKYTQTIFHVYTYYNL